MKEISAGGVVYRRIDDRTEIQLIQDRFGRIALPKGKMESGETVEQTALREIAEETGIQGIIKGQLASIDFRFQNPSAEWIDKEVFYYLVEAVGGLQMPQLEEISRVEWYSPQDAWTQQQRSGYDNNHEVLRKALTVLGFTPKAD